MNDGYKAVADLFRSKKSFLVTSHIDPDGDAIGSSLAIYSILKRLGREVKVVLEDEVPPNFAFLDGSAEVRTGEVEPCEVGVVVDSASVERTGRVKDMILACDTVVNIDHHRSNDNFGDYNLVIQGTGACGEIVYRLLLEIGEGITLSEAEALYVAILSDTGCFRFPTTTADTMRIAAHLLDLGVKPYHAASEIFWNRSPRALRLLSSSLATLEITNDGAIASMEVTRQMYEATGASPKDTEGFANYPRSIRDVLVGILIREIDEGVYRVSLRSREGYNVDGIAKTFGGGGHPTAAGFRIRGQLETIKQNLRKAIDTNILQPHRVSDTQ